MKSEHEVRDNWQWSQLNGAGRVVANGHLQAGILSNFKKRCFILLIREESLYYEHKKHDGSLPIVGVNTFLPPEGEGETGERELMRSSKPEKDQQVANVEAFRDTHAEEARTRLKELQKVARERKNTFAALMEAGKVCSLGSMSHALYDVGGEYRRNMYERALARDRCGTDATEVRAGATWASFAGTAFLFSKEVPANGCRACPSRH
jgi:hypothetical protein